MGVAVGGGSGGDCAEGIEDEEKEGEKRVGEEEEGVGVEERGRGAGREEGEVGGEDDKQNNCSSAWSTAHEELFTTGMYRC